MCKRASPSTAGITASLEFNPRDSAGRRCAATAATTATEGRRRSRCAHGKAPAVEAAREELEVEAARDEPAVAATSEQRAAGGSDSDDDGERRGREVRGGGEEREREDRKGKGGR